MSRSLALALRPALCSAPNPSRSSDSPLAPVNPLRLLKHACTHIRPPLCAPSPSLFPASSPRHRSPPHTHTPAPLRVPAYPRVVMQSGKSSMEAELEEGTNDEETKKYLMSTFTSSGTGEWSADGRGCGRKENPEGNRQTWPCTGGGSSGCSGYPTEERAEFEATAVLHVRAPYPSRSGEGPFSFTCSSSIRTLSLPVRCACDRRIGWCCRGPAAPGGPPPALAPFVPHHYE